MESQQIHVQDKLHTNTQEGGDSHTHAKGRWKGQEHSIF